MREQKDETCADQMTDSFQAHKDDTAILEPSACDAFRACEHAALRCVCSVCGCTVNTHTVDFLEFFPGNRNHHHFSDDVGCHDLQLVCYCEVGRCEVKDEDEDEDEDAAGGFPRGSL